MLKNLIVNLYSVEKLPGKQKKPLDLCAFIVVYWKTFKNLPRRNKTNIVE